MIEEYIGAAVTFVWDKLVFWICLLAGVYFTFRLRFVQFRSFGHAIELISGKHDHDDEPGNITHFQALCAALSGTVGIGNIAGVPIAITLGGPGAIFWMWVVGLLGMATKFVEATLGTLYRIKTEDGDYRGGAMYYITKGLGENWKPLAMFFASSLAIGAFGIGGMFQSNQAASILFDRYQIPMWLTGVLLSIMVAMVVLGGIKRIGNVASKIAPFMCGGYVLGGLAICLFNFDQIPSVVNLILEDAFTGKAVAGGSIWLVITNGVRRAIFSNEAGLGTAPIAHAAVKTNYPIREGIVASLEPFIDTVVICSITAFVVLLSGAWQIEGSGGIEISTAAFNHFIDGFGTYFIPPAAFLFAFSTIITWTYYGETAIRFILGKKSGIAYKLIFVLIAFIGTIINLDIVVSISDLLIALMVVPNGLAIFLLLNKVRKEIDDYKDLKL